MSPNLLSPKNNYLTKIAIPLFRWSKPPFGDHYEISFASDAAFTQNVITYPASGTTFTPSVSFTEGKHYWRVRAYNLLNQVSGWSTPRVFTIDITPPSVPVLTFPAKGVSVSRTPRFMWSFVSSATRYQFQIDNDANFSSPVQTIISRSNYCYSPALPLGTYYWHVRAQDAAGNWSDWSTPFTVNIIH